MKVIFLPFLIISILIFAQNIEAEPYKSAYTCIEDSLFSLCVESKTFNRIVTNQLTITGVKNCNSANALATYANGTVFCDTDDTAEGGTYPGDVFVNETGDTMIGALLMQGAPIRFGHINLNITGVFDGSDLLRISSNESIELRADETTVFGALTANDELTVDGTDIEFSQFTNCFAFETDGSGSLSCRVDEIDYSAGDGLVLNEEAREFSLIDCASQEILKRNGDDTEWICAADNDSYPGDGVFVNRSGDNMTGNLTLSPGNVTADYYFGDGSQLTGISATDTNATTECADGEYLDGDGNCYNFNASVDDRLNDGLFLNFTPVKTTGNISNGSLVGYQAANNICHAYYPGSHMCQIHEILNTINQNKSIANFTATFRVSEGAPGYLANANDCDGWKTPLGSALGSIWVGNTDNGGSGSLVACNAERYIGCCS